MPFNFVLLTISILLFGSCADDSEISADSAKSIDRNEYIKHEKK